MIITLYYGKYHMNILSFSKYLAGMPYPLSYGMENGTNPTW